MYRIEQEKPSQEFEQAWLSAGRFLASKGGEGQKWIRDNLNLPIIEHLSFVIGSQLFFVFVEAAEVNFKYSQNLFLDACSQANATPCLMPMRKRITSYEPIAHGWGLVNAITGDLVDPFEMVSDELIEMTDWELHDFAIRKVVVSHLEQKGFNVFSTQSALNIDPSIWFEADGKHFWVVVRAARHPQKTVAMPQNINEIEKEFSTVGQGGYFAPVVVLSADEPLPLDPEADLNGNYLPLYRGHAMFVDFEGIQKLQDSSH